MTTNKPVETLSRNGVEASLYRCDALDFLKCLPEASVDLVISSPPYCVGKEYDRFTTVEGFQSELERIASTLVSALKPSGSLCWQVGNHVRKGEVYPLEYAVYEIFKAQPGLKLRNRVIWTFGHGEHAQKRLSGRHEVILWFTKTDDYYFDLDAVREPQKYPGKKHYRGAKKGQFSGNPLGKNPGDVWDIPNVKARHVEKTEHPCQFPIALARRLALALCPLNGTIIDPYMGSGSTGVAALKESRNFAGTDLEPKYVEIASRRLIETLDGTVPFRPDLPVRTPSPTEAVSIRPSHFLSREKKTNGANC